MKSLLSGKKKEIQCNIMIDRCLNVILKNGACFFEFISLVIFNTFTPNP
jgi:hypothetical protein